MTTTASSDATSGAMNHTEDRAWFSRRRSAAQQVDDDDTTLELQALTLAVGREHAAEVHSLLTAVAIEGGDTITQQLRLPRQAFFVLSGRLAITVADHPVAVLGPGSFFGESDTTRLQRPHVPRVHPLGRVVLGVAGPLEIPELHRLVPDLPTFTMAIGDETNAPTAPVAPVDDQHDDPHDDAMGLGLLERIAS